MSKISKDIILNATIDKKVMNIDTAVEKDPVALDAVVDTSGGVREVFHDETLDGKGTKKDPLRVNKNIIATKEDLESKADKATTLAGYGITDAYTKEEINTKFGSVYHVKGSVATYDDLPDDAGVGDVYNILDSGSNYVWTGTEWDKLSETVDLSDYATKSDLEEKQDKLTAGANITISDDNVISSTMPIADETQAGITKLYTTSGSNTDGAMTQKAVGAAISTHNTATDAHSNIRGVAGGLATLDNNAKVPMSQINDALIGNVSYQGLWNAATNTPFLADPTGGLPSGYKALGYINFYNSYIDTGVFIEETDETVEYDIKMTPSNTGCFPFGASSASAAENNTGSLFFNSGTIEYFAGNTRNIRLGEVVTGKDYIINIKIDQTTKNITVIENDLRITRSYGGSIISPVSIILGGLHYGSVRGFNYSGKIHYFVIKKNGVTVKQYQPAQRISDGAYGFYEQVNGEFVVSDGTSSFASGGGEIEIPKGYYYITTVAGDRFGLHFDVGDWVISSGGYWSKVDNTDAVSAVNGMTGNVTLTANDVGAYTKEEVDDLIDDIALPDNILVNNATDTNSVYIGNDKEQYVEGGDGNVLLGAATKVADNSQNNTVVGIAAQAFGQDGVAVGRAAYTKSQWATAVGYGAGAEDAGTVAIGTSAKAMKTNSMAIGRNATANRQWTTAIGNNATAYPIKSLAIGQSARAGAETDTSIDSGGQIAIGTNATTENGYSIAIGQGANSKGCGIAVGLESEITGSEGIAVGHSSNSARHGIALGTRAKVNEFGGVAIGLNTDSDGTNAVTIGNQSYARGQYSVALGGSAIVDYSAEFAVQLGEGTNSDAYTLQFRDYKLLYENGIMPYERLSEYSPSDGQVLLYDDTEGALVWRDVGSNYELPTASTVQLGGVKVGSGLSINSNGVLSANVQEGAKWGNISGNIADQTDLQNVVSDIQSQIDSLSAIGQFLAIWDCDTHIARYLTEGHEYQSGNYFIIGSVAAEGGTNYMPDGSTYPGYAVTTEDVKVSDMWFYDGEHWIYLANHERSIAVDADLDINSSNPVENKTVTAAIEELQNSVGVPQLASVDVLQVKTPEQQEERRLNYTDWMGEYSDIIVTLNLNKQDLLDKMYDLYVTISRFKTNKNLTYTVDENEFTYRNIAKFSVMNDLRQKTNVRAYCWRMLYDDSLPETNPARYCYFYTQDLYVDEQMCLEYAHKIGLWGGYAGPVGRATCLNAIGWSTGYGANDYLHDYGDTTIGIERYEEGDISEFANLSDTANYPEFNIKDYTTKRECRKYTRDGQNYFFWCNNWEDSNAAIYNITDGNDNPIPNGIPKHMDELYHVWNVFDFPSTFEFVEKRPDLNYKAINDPYVFLQALERLTFKDKFVDGEGRPPYWNCYWFDFPVMPILLKDCEVRAQQNATKEDYTASVNVGEWRTLEYLSKNNLLHALRDNLPVELKLPYNTYYLWMRFCSLQKRCAYGDYSNWLDEEGRGIDSPMWPDIKHNLVEGVRSFNVLGKRAFARPRQSYKINGESSKVSEYILFNLCTPMDAASGSKSKSTPIQKKLNIDTKAKTGLRD